MSTGTGLKTRTLTFAFKFKVTGLMFKFTGNTSNFRFTPVFSIDLKFQLQVQNESLAHWQVKSLSRLLKDLKTEKNLPQKTAPSQRESKNASAREKNCDSDRRRTTT